nr:hypothetical protein [Tanacetum cinerariifolium]
NGLAVFLIIEGDQFVHAVIVPAIMGRALEVPFDGAVIGVQRQPRRGIQVIARPHVRIPRRGVAGANQDLVIAGVVIAAKPRRRAAGLPQVARPGLVRLATGDPVFNGLAVLVDVP